MNALSNRIQRTVRGRSSKSPEDRDDRFGSLPEWNRTVSAAAIVAAAFLLPHFLPRPSGGCEGLAMLNRTNRTLSAHLNRLNLGLGTRTFALVAFGNNSVQTLRTRHAHCVVMRDGMGGDPMDRISYSILGIPSIPCSTPEPARPSPAVAERSRTERVVPVAPVSSLSAVVSVPPSWRGDSQPSSSLPFGTESPKPRRKPFDGKRKQQQARAVACVTARATAFVSAGG